MWAEARLRRAAAMRKKRRVFMVALDEDTKDGGRQERMIMGGHQVLAWHMRKQLGPRLASFQMP
jgi:hypothetical protein